jgi:hypothetical protein
MEIYFVKCKGCKGEIVIDREPKGEKVATVSGTFNTYPDCPHCGQKHLYNFADIKTRHEPEPAS